MTSLAIPENQDFNFESALKPGIRAAFAMLSSDYGEKFTRQFRASGDGVKPLTPDRWQYRLLSLLVGMEDMPDIAPAAVDAIAKRCGDCPTLVEIVAECRAIRVARRNAAERRREAEHYANLLPPARATDAGEIAGMIKQAIDTENPGRNCTQEEHNAWIKRKAESELRLNVLISAGISAGRIRRGFWDGQPECAVSHCRNAGALSLSTQGGDEYYCREHFRR